MIQRSSQVLPCFCSTLSLSVHRYRLFYPTSASNDVTPSRFFPLSPEDGTPSVREPCVVPRAFARCFRSRRLFSSSVFAVQLFPAVQLTQVSVFLFFFFFPSMSI